MVPPRKVLRQADVSATSPSYLERLWPRSELEAFSETAADNDRIFAVELLPPVDSYPAQLHDLKRKAFWWKDEKRGSAPRKSTPKYEPILYTDYLGDVAYLIAQRLREMLAASDPSPTIASATAKKSVLLA